AVAVRVLEDEDCVLSRRRPFPAGAGIRVVLGDPEAAAVVDAEGVGLADVGLGREEVGLESGGHGHELDGLGAGGAEVLRRRARDGRRRAKEQERDSKALHPIILSPSWLKRNRFVLVML